MNNLNYFKLYSKLDKLGKCQRIINSEEEPISEKVLKKSDKLKREIYSILTYSDFFEILQALASSGMMDIFYGKQGEYMIMEISGFDCYENGIIHFFANGAYSSTMNMPSDIKNCFGDRYMIKLK